MGDWYELDAYCVAPKDYTGPCLPFQSLSGLSNEDRRSWSKACLAPFPCGDATLEAAPCEPSRPCPDGWSLVGTATELCQAGADYKGPCRPAMTTSEIQRIGTRRFAAACSVTWSDCAPGVLPEVEGSVQEGTRTIESASGLSAGVSGPIADDGRLLVLS